MVGVGEGTEVDVERFFKALRRRKWLILALVVGMTGSAYLLSQLRDPVYEADARILVQPRLAESLFDSDAAAAEVDPELTIATEIAVLESRPVEDAVRAELGPVPDVDAQRSGETSIMKVKVRSGDRDRAVLVADRYVSTFIELRRRQAADDLSTAGNELREKIGQVEDEIEALDTRISGLQSGAQAAANDDRAALATRLALFKQRLDEIEVEAALKSGGVQLVAGAFAPSSPVSPKPARNAAVALGVSLLLGVALASFVEYVADSVTTRDDLAEAAAGLPVLAAIPGALTRRRRSGASEVDLGHLAGEAYRSLRTSIQLLRVDRPHRVIQVTSPVGAEGKTTTVANLGRVLAAAGERVVVVDADLRRPRLHEPFGLDSRPGLTSVLAGQATLEEALQVVPSQPRLGLLASGPPAPSPSELLGSKRTSQVFFELQSHFDVVLVDSTPTLPVTDAAVVSAWVDGTIVVVSVGTKRKVLRATLEQLRQVEAPVIGVVLNRASPDGGYGYGYGYSHDHDHLDEKAAG